MFEQTFKSITDCAIVGGYADAVIWIAARFGLVDQVSYGGGVRLVGAENERFLVLVDLAHEDVHAVLLALHDLDAGVEIGFGEGVAGFHGAFHHDVIGDVGVLVHCRCDLTYLERRQKAVVDAFLQRVGENRLAEIAVGVGVVLAARRGGEAQLHGGREIFHDAAPGALIVGATAVAFVDDDEVEEVGRVVVEICALWFGVCSPARGGAVTRSVTEGAVRRCACRRLRVVAPSVAFGDTSPVYGGGNRRRASHERLEDREEDVGVLRDAAGAAHFVG